MIRAVSSRSCGGPAHSRLAGSWAAAIAHEVARDLVFSEIGFRKARALPIWKSEGYADYSANLAAATADPDCDLRSRIELLLDDDTWQSPTGHVDRRHFRWHVGVEYLCTVQDLGFTELMDEAVTEEAASAEMLAWCASLDSDARQ